MYCGLYYLLRILLPTAIVACTWASVVAGSTIISATAAVIIWAAIIAVTGTNDHRRRRCYPNLYRARTVVASIAVPISSAPAPAMGACVADCSYKEHSNQRTDN